ncbi:MAG: hypothetical protein RML12_04295 [Xanthomonadales bacterium]|nr:hypothetical protein [Xanthomonadales bacterium]
MQHAGSDSYRIGARDGVLRIERHGPEPWGKVVQAIPAAALVGRTLEFSAELRGELAPPGERFVTPSGLVAVVHGAPPGAPAILGETVLGQRLGEPELGEGRHGWKVQRLRLEVPEGASRIELGLILGHQGWIELRHPALRPLP